MTTDSRPQPSATEKLEDILKNGLVTDVYRMERAYLLHREIGTHADALNSRQNGNFGEFFGVVQQALEAEASLAVARVYDKLSKRHPTRCLEATLNVLEKRGHELPEIREPFQTREALSVLLVGNAEVAESAEKGKDTFLKALVPAMRELLENPATVEGVDRLKRLRDKRVAHNEAADVNGPTWEDLGDLISYAKGFIGVVGWAFLGTAYVINGEYTLSSDARKPSICLARLVKRLETMRSDSMPG
jgi:hypothetical protein